MIPVKIKLNKNIYLYDIFYVLIKNIYNCKLCKEDDSIFINCFTNHDFAEYYLFYALNDGKMVENWRIEYLEYLHDQNKIVFHTIYFEGEDSQKNEVSVTFVK